MASRQARKWQAREQHILQVAATLIERVGFAALTMDALADEAGIAKATLYQHFKSKHDLVAYALYRAFDHLAQFMAGLSGPAIEQLVAVMRYMLTTGYDPDGFLASFMHDDLTHQFQTDERIAGQFIAGHQHLTHLIEQAKAENDIALDLADDVIITAMFNSLRIMNAKSMLRSTLPANTIIDQAIRIFRRGIEP